MIGEAIINNSPPYSAARKNIKRYCAQHGDEITDSPILISDLNTLVGVGIGISPGGLVIVYHSGRIGRYSPIVAREIMFGDNWGKYVKALPIFP